MNKNPDFSKVGWAGFVESFVKELLDLDPVSIGVCAILRDGKVLTGYNDAGPTEMALMAHHIRSDAMFEEIEANASWLRQVLEAAEDSDESEDEPGREADEDEPEPGEE